MNGAASTHATASSPDFGHRAVLALAEEWLPGRSPFPDERTRKLLDEAGHWLEVAPHHLLQEYREYWAVYTAVEAYGESLRAQGWTLHHFLLNLNGLIRRVSALYPALTMPQFRCTQVREGGLTLHYHSQRSGRIPMDLGFCYRLGAIFQTHLQLLHVIHQRLPPNP